jgi:TPR repeat protein
MEHLEQQGRAVDDDLVTWLAESRDAAFSPDGAELLVPDDFRPHAHKMRVISMLEMGRRAVDRGDLDVAQAWLERALRAQIPAEAGAMADYLLEQLEEKSDLTAMWVAMAESGDILAMYNAGLCFWRKEQLDEAEHWWRRGAEAGDVECETKVGVVNFQTGNLQEAERWFQRAAEQNEPVALFNLGVLAHQRGANDEAAQWFARAGDAGHEGAAEVLQKLQKVAADGA